MGRFSEKKRNNFSQNFNVLRLQVVVTPQGLQIAGNSLPNNPSIVYIYTACLFNCDVFRAAVQRLTRFQLT